MSVFRWPERGAAPRAASESERRVEVEVVEIADGALTGGGVDEDSHLRIEGQNRISRGEFHFGSISVCRCTAWLVWDRQATILRIKGTRADWSDVLKDNAPCSCTSGNM